MKIRRMTSLTENANYDIKDIATDEEASKVECNCMIHSGGHTPGKVTNYMRFWSDWGDPKVKNGN